MSQVSVSKSMFKMCGFVFVLIVGLLVPFIGFSQVSVPDSLVVENDSTFVNDSVKIDSTTIVTDSLEHELIQDTINQILNIKEANKIIDESELIDTIFMENDQELRPDSVLSYPEFISKLSDSLIFDTPDTLHYVIEKLGNFLENDTLIKNDTTLQAINKLIEYRNNLQIDSVIKYLEAKINEPDFLFHSEDSSLINLNDSIKTTIAFVLSSIPDDSVKLLFTNSINDSILFALKETEIDSIHFKLYDNRGEYGELWIKKSDKNIFSVSLDEGIYIEKPRQQAIVKQEIDTDFKMPGLKEMKKVGIILPVWKYSSTADLRFNQGVISESWAEGGENSMSALSIFKINADYTYGKKRTWDSDIEYRLGYLRVGESPIQKNNDKFELNSKYGRTAFNNWYYSFLLNFKTQFLKGYDYPNDSIAVSEFLSPAYLVFSLGLDYKPSKELTVLISPITSKFTIVADTVRYNQTLFGVGENEKIRKEIGAYVKVISKISITKDIILQNKVNFFSNYTENPQNIDVDWEADLAVKINEYFKISVYAHLIYDDDVVFVDKNGVEHGPRIQFKETFGVGFTYNFR